MKCKWWLCTHGLVRVWGDPQSLLQAAAVLVHAQREVSVAFVYRSHPLLDLYGVTVAFLTEAISKLDEELHTFFSLLKERRQLETWTVCSDVCTCVRKNNLGCDVEVLVLLEQLLCVVNAGTSGSVCGQVKLPSVMNPLQSLKTHR